MDQVLLGAKGTTEGELIPEDIKKECQGWRLVLTGHSLGGATASIVALFLREKFPNLRVYAIEPPGGLLGIELAKETESFCTSSVHGLDAIARLSGPALLKLRAEVINALVRCKLNKFQFIMKLVFARRELNEADVFDDCESEEELPSESTSLRQSFVQFAQKQIEDSPNMAAPLYPPGKLLYLRKVQQFRKVTTTKKSGRRKTKRSKRRKIFQCYELRKISAKELMDRGMSVGPSFFVDHFPDTVAALLSELAVATSSVRQDAMTLPNAHSPLEDLVEERDCLSSEDDGDVV